LTVVVSRNMLGDIGRLSGVGVKRPSLPQKRLVESPRNRTDPGGGDVFRQRHIDVAGELLVLALVADLFPSPPTRGLIPGQKFQLSGELLLEASEEMTTFEDCCLSGDQ